MSGTPEGSWEPEILVPQELRIEVRGLSARRWEKGPSCIFEADSQVQNIPAAAAQPGTEMEPLAQPTIGVSRGRRKLCGEAESDPLGHKNAWKQL